MDFVILETNIYEVIYGVYIYMYVVKAIKTGFTRLRHKLDTFC